MKSPAGPAVYAPNMSAEFKLGLRKVKWYGPYKS